MEYYLINKPKKEVNKKKKTIQSIKNTNRNKDSQIRNKNLKTSSKEWLRRHINDPFVQQARIDGLVSRSAYKIMEIDEKYNIMKSPSIAIDIGSAPGGWIQAIWSKIGHKKSQLIGVDLLDLVVPIEEQQYSSNIHFIKGDFTDPDTISRIDNILTNKADVIVSDMAPNTIGSNIADHLAISLLAESIIEFAYKNLKKDGNLLFKIFHGERVKPFLTELKKKFKMVKVVRPVSSRKKSPELYIVATSYKGSDL